MEVRVAEKAGFCFGVNKAVKVVLDLLRVSGKNVYTIGPVIHNEQMIAYLKAKGVKVINSVNEASAPGCIVIRAHGVTPEVYREIKNSNLDVVDATCPHVKKIHRLVRQKFEEGFQIIIAGDFTHPEVIGINGWCGNSAYIVDSAEDVDGMEAVSGQKYCVVAQTTITHDKWHTVIEKLNNRFKNLIIFDTICNATILRQTEAEQMAKSSDMMIVVGGRNSSNTGKLFEICMKYCPETYKIETADDLPHINTEQIKKAGITAGASTPDWIIKEVVQKMSELNVTENELSFKEAFESSLVTLHTGEIVKGRIIGFNNTEVYVDMGYKSDGIIPIGEFTDDPFFKPEDSLKIGEEVEVFVIRVNDGEGNVLLSKKKVDSSNGLIELDAAYNNKTSIKVKVVEVINGGVIAVSRGTKVFIPASQIGSRYSKNLNDYPGKIIDIKIIEFDKQKRKIVGSQRVLLDEERERNANSFWENIKANKKYPGVVKSLTDFGAFVDIGGIDGLIHLSEMSWTKIKHPSEILKVGDRIEVSVLEFDREKKRISLSLRKEEDNPWNNAEDRYRVGDVVKGKVVRLVPFGVFLELEKGIDGLVHISQITSKRISKPDEVLHVGQEVKAKIIEVNIESKKINLSIKEADIEINEVNDTEKPMDL